MHLLRTIAIYIAIYRMARKFYMELNFTVLRLHNRKIKIRQVLLLYCKDTKLLR